MTRDIPLEATFSGPDRALIAKALLETGLASEAELVIPKRLPVVRVDRPHFTLELRDLLKRLASVPFELAAFRAYHLEWRTPWDTKSDAAPPSYGFADGHWSHGWACAFRGTGHERLVSRRWLDFGPWRVHRGAHDTSLVELHDVEADAAASHAQCVRSHRRMGGSVEGGFIQSHPPLPARAPGDYLPSTRQLRIPVYGREVTQHEMLDARTIVKVQALGPDRPLTGATYVFAEEAAARAHLHELWLRELGCVTYVNGVETDLAAAYAPTPVPHVWAR